MKKIISMSVLTFAFVAVLGIANTKIASASVWNCKTGYSSVGAWAKCLSGTPSNVQYRVNVLCAGIFNSYSYKKSGNWVKLGSQTPTTIGGCGWMEHYVGQPTVSSNK
jgi:hypothetical protein